ncbi:MAG: glycosyltransferase family 2 protein [Bacteroidales bacterium]|nr:glycosyltransferase family 2 protein [Bacteroidales bacterium]
MLDELVRRISEAVKTITDEYEIILVNDMSPDNSWDRITEICAIDNHVKGIELSRNFGQHYAISAGLAHVSGDWIVVMDCDLQDRPEEIPNLYAKAVEGYDIVYARRAERQDSFFKKLSSTMFFAIYNWMSGSNEDKAIANFGVYKRSVIDEFNKMPEYTRSFGSLIRYVGFKIGTIDVQHDERLEGSTGYTLFKLLKLSFDVIISNSNKPLRLTVSLGFIMSMLSFILALYNIIAKLVGIIQVPGFTATIFSIWFVGGLILFVLGIIGLYVGKIFDQVKGRQIFIVRSKLNF